MKLILFDIDGTLVNTGKAGVRAMNRTFQELHGVASALDGIPLAGRTDRVILRDALARLEPLREMDESWLSSFRERYCVLLEEEMEQPSGPSVGKRVLPGVYPLLESLAGRDDVVVALLTGNFEPAAQIKLGHFGLWKYFSAGAFGDAHVDRNLLLDVAREAARAGPSEVTPDRICVIGDTPHDVVCARTGGARAVAVATGINTVEELRQSGADVVFRDLADTADVLSRGLGLG